MKTITRKQAIAEGSKRYFTGKPCKHGHLSEKLTSSATCIECIRIDAAKRRKENWAHVHTIYKRYARGHRALMNEISMKSYNRKPKKERTERQFDCRQANYVNYLFSRVKGRAKYKGMEFNISKEDIVIPEKCPVLGIPLYFSKGHNRGNTPSVDRIDNAKGYVKGNVAVISMKANALKKNATIEELKSILAYMEQHRKLQNEK